MVIKAKDAQIEMALRVAHEVKSKLNELHSITSFSLTSEAHPRVTEESKIKSVEDLNGIKLFP